MSSPPHTTSRAGALRRLLALARPEARLLVAGGVFLALASVMGLAYPQAIGRVLNEALGGVGTGLIDRAALAMLVIFLVQGLAIGFRAYFFTVAGERIVSRLRKDLFARILAQEVGFFDQRRTGELTSRLASDASVLQSAVSVNVSMVLRNIASMVGGVALLFYTSAKLAAIMLAVVPPMALSAVWVGRKIQRLARQAQDALAAANEVAEEGIAGIRTVRAFSAEPREAARYAAKVDHSFALARRRILTSATFMGTMSGIGYGAVALVLWIGGRMVVAGDLSIGALTSFVLYTLIVAFAFGSLGELWADFMRAIGAAERVFELLDRTPAQPAGGGRRLAPVDGRIALRGVSFAYPSRPDVGVLHAIDLEIAPGEAVALVGASGGGKSTVAALLLRLYDPGAGRIELDGVDLRELDDSWLRDQIGVVAQEPILFSTTIRENIRYGRPTATDAEVEVAAATANAKGFIEALPDRYETLVGERGVQLSGGQRQRVAIARAVLKDPRILIFDEATSALDAESEALVKQALDRLMEGRTTLVIAHRLSTVRDADRILVMEDGRIVDAGDHAELMQREGVYRRLVEHQVVLASG